MSSKKAIHFVLIAVLVLQTVLAVESNSLAADPLMTEAGLSEGANPDTFSYKWGNFWNQVSYSLTFDKEAKAQKGLQIARRRLWEVKVFSESKELNKAQEAQKWYSEWISKVKENVNGLGAEDPKTELEQNVRLNAELDKEEDLLQEVKSEIESSSKLTVQEKNQANMLVGKAMDKKEEVKQSLNRRQEKAETKFKARFGLKEKDLEAEIQKIESKREEGKRVEKTDEVKEIRSKKMLEINRSNDNRSNEKDVKEMKESKEERKDELKEKKELKEKEQEEKKEALDEKRSSQKEEKSERKEDKESDQKSKNR